MGVPFFALGEVENDRFGISILNTKLLKERCDKICTHRNVAACNRSHVERRLPGLVSTNVGKDFFISYTSADKQWAEWIAWQLEGAQYSTILQAWDFQPGVNFVLEMDKASRVARCTLVVLSPDYLSAQYTQPEWAVAFRRDPTSEQRAVLPVRVQKCEVEGLLGPIVYIDLVDLEEAVAREALLAGVRSERGKPETAPGFPMSAPRTVSDPQRWHPQ
jgi:hypothetical protein